MAAAQSLNAQFLGFVPVSGAPSPATTQLATATTWLAFSFIPDASKTVSELDLFNATKTGTLASTDLTADVYSDTNGSPSSSGSIGSTATVTTAANNTMLRFTGLSVAVTAGTQYWAVFKNVNATPGSNNPTYQYGVANSAPAIWGSDGASSNYGWMRKNTTTGDGGWGSAALCSAGLRVGYSDGSFAGCPLTNIAGSASTTRAQGTTEMGMKLTIPANFNANVSGAAMLLGPTGNPVTGTHGNLEFKLYTGSGATQTLQATTFGVPKNTLSSASAQFVSAFFSSPVALTGGTVVRVTAHQAGNGGDSSNTYYCPVEYAWDTDAASLAMVPLGGVKTWGSNGSWTDVSGAVIPFALILDSNGMFNSGGGGTTNYVISSTTNRFMGNPEDF